MGVGACKVNLRGYEMGGRGPLLFVVVDIRVIRGSVGSPQSSSVWNGGVLGKGILVLGSGTDSL